MELMPRFAHKAMKEGRRLGFALGREEGREQGREEGREQGREEGREEGIEEGLEKGLEKGRLIGQRDLLLDQLAARFGMVPDDICLRLSSAGEAELRHWARALCDAHSLAEIFT